MTVLITLTTAGIDTGPFDLYSNLDFYAIPFEIGISKFDLQSGYSSSVVPDYTQIIRAKSNGTCINYTDIVLITTTSTSTTVVPTTTTTTITPTTTTTTTSEPEVSCNETVVSGGEGITENFINLSPLGGLITIALNAYGVPDKVELIHNGSKKATSGMIVPNEGPFDNLYGDPTVPTEPDTMSVDQFIGVNKGSIPDRQSTYTSETGSSLLLPVGFQQLVWWQYTGTDYSFSPTVTIRVTGPTGTAWDIQRVCEVTTTTSTTTIAPSTTTTTTTSLSFLSLAYSGLNNIGGIDPTFSTARTTGGSTTTTSFSIACYLQAGTYNIRRGYFGFDTTSITTATVGGIQINIFSNDLVNPVQFAVVRTITNFPSNHNWVVGDYPESNGGVLETTAVTINPGQTGIVNIPFNATGLSYINGSNDCTFVLVQYTNDGLNIAPSSGVNESISGINSDVKLYYN